MKKEILELIKNNKDLSKKELNSKIDEYINDNNKNLNAR